jgi:polyferredoxin
MCSAFSWRILTRVPLEITVIRERNQLFVENARGEIENIYTLRILNMDEHIHSYSLRIEGLENASIVGGTEITLAAAEVRSLPLRIAAPREGFQRPSTSFEFIIEANDGSGWSSSTESRFLIPLAK